MQTLNFPQGSPQWHAHRATARNASDAPAMLDCSPYKTRAQLLRERATGVRPEVDAFQERRFADGHAIEAAQRPGAEAAIGEDLAPVVGKAVVDGIELSASFDGLTLLGDTAYECKTLNDDLRAVLLYESDMANQGQGRLLPKHYRAQMEQQLMVCGGERVLFVAATKDGSEVRRCWYFSDASLRAEILAGWRQFDADLAAYVAPAAAEPTPTGRAPESLPALRIELTGAVTASNLAEFKATALGAIQSVNRNLSTDQDFADAKQAVKWCGEVESRIKAAKDHALSQTASIDELFRTLDDVSAEARRVRLDLEKLVARREDELKGELVAEARNAYTQHVDALKAETGGAWIPLTPPDFGAAIKGKRNFDSMRDALATALANGKIAANESAAKIRAALAMLDAESAGYEFLFRDRLSFISKAPEDVQALARARITEHKVAEERRLEQERDLIRREEADRVEREAAAKAEAERRAEEARQRAAAPAPAPQDVIVRTADLTEEHYTQAVQIVREHQRASISLVQRHLRIGYNAAATMLERMEREGLLSRPDANGVRSLSQTAVAAPAPVVVPLRPARELRLGEINEALAPISITAEGLARLGIHHARIDRAAKLYDCGMPAIVAALQSHLSGIGAQQEAAA